MPLPPAAATPACQLIIDKEFVRASALRAGRLALEAAVVPALLLYAALATVGQFWGLISVLVWSGLIVAVRLRTQSSVPRTLLIAVLMLVGRTSLSLALSSIYVYLLQPIAGSLMMAFIFLGSAAIGKPITKHLCRDFIALPQMLFHDKRAHRMFSQVCILWGASRLVDVGMNMGFLHLGARSALLSRGVFSTSLTLLTIVVCIAWGWSRLRRMPEFSIAFA
ncbi:hypothetical protein [Flexivirga oryzae]|uniref:DUF3159 domain-containing protein n=1 Tax=Flexivirga oryzae TaxID=1794944 RepID=A0A839N8Z8_9MICO|nr:hypothetical protein [Flexivirga oryzae]MBB2893687.1 hypothetical protein [Flexivirga oryzae]